MKIHMFVENYSIHCIAHNMHESYAGKEKILRLKIKLKIISMIKYLLSGACQYVQSLPLSLVEFSQVIILIISSSFNHRWGLKLFQFDDNVNLSKIYLQIYL